MSYPVGNTGVSYAQKTITTTPVLAGNTIATDAFTLAAGQIGILQNQATTALYVRYGGAASLSAYHYVIPACVVIKDGTSPALVIDSWIGVVSVFPASGTSSYAANVIS
jgi:hypothetical protein